MIFRWALPLLAGTFLLSSASLGAEWVSVPAGVHEPLYRDKGEAESVDLPAFEILKTPVTNSQFLKFVKKNPGWKRSHAPRVFVDENYLASWSGEEALAPGQAQHPVTQISWFAARAYCQSLGGRLPSLSEWEHATDILNPEFNSEILKWYSTPTQALGAVGQRPANKYGVHDGWGLIWEWVEDFSTVIMSGDSRDKVGEGMFCGAGSLGARDPEQYAMFLRYAFWSSLQAPYGSKRLGFRCVRDKGESR